MNNITQICCSYNIGGGTYRRTATATCLYDSFCHIFLHSFSLHLFVSQNSLNDEERGGNCLLVPERSYGPVNSPEITSKTGQQFKKPKALRPPGRRRQNFAYIWFWRRGLWISAPAPHAATPNLARPGERWPTTTAVLTGTVIFILL